MSAKTVMIELFSLGRLTQKYSEKSTAPILINPRIWRGGRGKGEAEDETRGARRLESGLRPQVVDADQSCDRSLGGVMATAFRSR